MVSMHRDVCFLKQNNNWSKLRGIVSTAHMKLADCNHVVLKASWLPSHSFGVFQRCHDVLGLLILHVLVELRKTLSLRLSCYDAFCYQSNGVCPHIFEEAMRFVFALGLFFRVLYILLCGSTYNCQKASHSNCNHSIQINRSFTRHGNSAQGRLRVKNALVRLYLPASLTKFKQPLVLISIIVLLSY